MDDLSRFCCLHSRCPDVGRRDAGNLTVTGQLGEHRQYRLLYCRSCHARFSERQGTPLYRAHLPEEKVTSILEHVTEGCGVRQTARLLQVHPDTVSRYIRAAGAQARAAHDDLVARSPETREIQMDEAWSFVAKKEKNCDDDEPADRFRGDCWDHVAFDPEHRLVVSVVPADRAGRGRASGARVGRPVGRHGTRTAIVYSSSGRPSPPRPHRISSNSAVATPGPVGISR
jgi:transposase-like protein